MLYDYTESFPQCHAGDMIIACCNAPCDVALITERDYSLAVNRGDDAFLLRVSAVQINDTHMSLSVPFDGDWRMVAVLYDEADVSGLKVTCKYHPADVLQFNAAHADSKIVSKQVGGHAPCSLQEWKHQTGSTFNGNISCCCSCFRVAPLSDFECVKVSVASKAGAAAYYATPICHHCAISPAPIHFQVPTSALYPCK